MLIVSQNKNTIVNFERVNIIHVNNLNKKEIGAWFNCNEDKVDNVVLGTYKTEERAKEVLQKIIRCYSATENYKLENENGRELIAINNDVLVYEMPED